MAEWNQQDGIERDAGTAGPAGGPTRRRTSVVSGSNVGIGYETAVGLAAFGDRVIMACRNRSKAESARTGIIERSGNDDVHIVDLDLSSFASIDAAVASIREITDRVDVLVNNAGLVLSERQSTAEGIEMTFGVNHIGTFLFTMSMQPLLLAGSGPGSPARVVTLASAAHLGAFTGLPIPKVIDPPRYNGWLAYCRSKLANQLFARELARRWAGHGIVSQSVHPGIVRTNFAMDGDVTSFVAKLMETRAFRPFSITPQRGADTPIWLATSDEGLSSPGQYWHRRKRGLSTPVARNMKTAERLWEFTEQVIAQRR